MFNPMVVPLDGSELAERALAPARALARFNHAELHLVRVAVAQQLFVPVDAGYAGVLYPDESLAEALQGQQAESYLARLKAACTEDSLRLKTQTLEGEVASAIVDEARESQAGLIVMSSHGYSGVRRWLLGSVAEKVLDAAPCPVWIVRAAAPPRHLLIALDGSRLAEEVLQPALNLARCFGVRVTLLRVVPVITAPSVKQLDSLEYGLGPCLVDEAQQAAADYLARVADRCGDEALDLRTAVRSGPAAETLLEYAERQEVDLVAMTTHGRTGLRRWLYGSVTHKVLSKVPVAMLVARSRAADLD